MQKWLKSILKIGGILVVIILLLAFLIPLLFKKEIENKVKEFVNSSIQGKFDYSNLSLSFFKHFPTLTLTLHDAKVDAYINQDTSSLFNAKNLDLSLDFWNLFSKDKPLNVKRIYLDQANINIIQYSATQANYQITKTNSTENNNSAMQLNIDEYNLINGNITYQDLPSNLAVIIRGISHQGSGDIDGDIYAFTTKTTIDSLTYVSNNLSYLKNVNLQSDIKFKYDKSKNNIHLQDNEIKLNALQLNSAGDITIEQDGSYTLDLQFKAPGNSFKDIFSLVPYAYTKNYENLKSSGQFNLSGMAKGKYAASGIYPDWKIEFNVNDGQIQYPEKNLKFDQVNIRMLSNNVGPSLDQQLLDIKQFEFNCNNSPFEGKLLLSGLTKDMHAAGNCKGVLHLKNFAKLMPESQANALAGLLSMDLDFDFSQSQLDLNQYENIKLSGLIHADELSYNMPNQPAIFVPKLDMNFTPKQLSIENGILKPGNSDIMLSGKINNPLHVFSTSSYADGEFTINGKLLDLNEWMSNTTSESTLTQSDSSSSVLTMGRHFKCKLITNFKDIKYDTYKISDLSTNATFDKDQLSISSSNFNLNGSFISMSGNLNEPLAYTYLNKPLKGQLNLQSKQFDLIQFLADDANAVKGSTAENSDPFLVPENMDLDINFKLDEFLYEKMKLNNFTGRLKMVDQQLQMHDMVADGMGGKMALSGVYNSENHHKPVFDIKYDLKQMSFQKAFQSFSSLAKFAPLMAYIDGAFNTSFVCNGSLGKDMFPDLSSINLDGILETLKGEIKGLKPLNNLAQKLSISELNNLNIQNTKNWFKVENGTVSLKDFNRKIQDIDMTVNGQHSLTGPMDYAIKMRIPRQKFKQVNGAVDNGLNYLKQLGSKAGVNVELGAFVNVLVELGGSILDPKMNIKLLGADGESLEDSGKNIVEEAKETVKDSLRKKADEELSKAKQKALDEAKRIEDSLRLLANKKMQEEGKKVIDKAATEVTKHVDSTLVKKTKDVLEDKLGKGAGKILNDTNTTDQIKDKLKNWDPFKKKK